MFQSASQVPASSSRNRSPKISRRALVGSGAAAAAATFFRTQVAQAVPKSKRIRIGVVGGRFGAAFYWHEHPNCTVAAVTDLRPERRERLRRVYRCDNVFDSMEEMIRKYGKHLDALAIFTEAPNHVRHSVMAMEAGLHVCCAVPAAMTLEECERLIETTRRTGLTFMMAETSYWQQHTITARKLYQEGAFGHLYAAYSMYRHPGLEVLFFEGGKPTWRHGFPPMHYPTHCTAHLIGVTGERLTEVVCHGWGDRSPALVGNPYNNPFWNETAQFKTDRGNTFRVEVWWAGAHRGCERAEWYGSKLSFFCATPYGTPPLIVRAGKQRELDDGGFVRAAPAVERYKQVEWWRTDMLPEPLRHPSGHHGSHTFITHEFIQALVEGRRPAVDVYEAVAYTAPGIVAHQSALKGGELLKVPDFGRAKD